jgi:glycosyltransferase involved in cell wall biosynthesis
VVASAVGGLREAIRDGENGFLVLPGSTPALTDRIIRLARDADLRARLGRAARQTVHADFRIEDKVQQLQQIWLEAAGRT